jgi:hypothetical protein
MNDTPTSWACEVEVEGKWASNALRFATPAEAEMHGRELLSRWFVPSGYRATASEDPVNARMPGEYQRAEHLEVPATEPVVVACVMCGHLHYLGNKLGYSDCPIEGCDCAGQTA